MTSSGFRPLAVVQAFWLAAALLLLAAFGVPGKAFAHGGHEHAAHAAHAVHEAQLIHPDHPVHHAAVPAHAAFGGQSDAASPSAPGRVSATIGSQQHDVVSAAAVTGTSDEDVPCRIGCCLGSTCGGAVAGLQSPVVCPGPEGPARLLLLSPMRDLASLPAGGPRRPPRTFA